MNLINKIGKNWQFSFLLLLILLGILYFARIKSTLLPVKVIKIIGSYQHVQQDELITAVMPHVGTSILFMNLNGLSRSISQIPWVADVATYRVWPGTVAIRFSEQTPYAQWGDEQLMNADGDVFTPNAATIPKNLPQLQGPINERKQVLQTYQKMNKMLAVIGLTIKKIDMNNPHAYQITLNNGTQLIMNAEDPEVEIENYIKSYKDLFSQKSNQSISVDLRYRSAMAVKEG